MYTVILFENFFVHEKVSYMHKEVAMTEFLHRVQFMSRLAKVEQDINVPGFCKVILNDDSNCIFSVGLVGCSQEENTSLLKSLLY
jgi:hypothetical protein